MTIINSGGINTRQIDGFRQGVSIRTNRQRYEGSQPRLWAGSLIHEHKQHLFDSTSEKTSETTTYDDAKSVLTLSSSVVSVVSGSSISAVFEQKKQRKGTNIIGSVVGEMCQGNTGDFAVQYISFDELTNVLPYTEQGTQTLSSTSSYIAQHGELSGSSVYHAELLSSASTTFSMHVVQPFDDSSAVTPCLPKDYIASDTHVLLRSVMQQLSCSTEVFEFERHRSMQAGFVYHTTPFGTDSLAFGGLSRYVS